MDKFKFNIYKNSQKDHLPKDVHKITNNNYRNQVPTLLL